MGRRSSGRAAARRAAAALGSAPKVYEGIDDDEPMRDADTSEIEPKVEAEPEPEPEPEQEQEQEPEPDPEPEDDDEAAPEESGDDAVDKEEDASAEESVKEPTPPPVTVIRRKRLGRPPKNRPPDWDNMITVTESDATPRRRGRGGWRGRGGRKGQAPPVKQQQAIDKEGTVAEIADDECVLPEDPDGETKVDKLGNLQGDREYRCRTFTVLGRGKRLYMLSTEPARCVGFRDSYLFFTKHLKLYKIIVDDDEKRDMIERDIIPHSYKGRAIGIVTARSVFREFGARIIVGGRRIIDDYDVAGARAEGAVEGEIADPTDKFVEGEPYNKNQYVAWHGASAVYHQTAPAVQMPIGKPEPKKRHVNVNHTNWMLEHAREASLFNSKIHELRQLNLDGVYDIHTNSMHYPAIMQPTRARFVQVGPEETDPQAGGSSVFPPLPPKVARNFFVTDTYYETPPVGVSAKAYGEEDAADFLAPFRGLAAVSDEIKDLLPPHCRQSFDEALANELEWKAKMDNEKHSGSRKEPIIDKAIVPYSMNL